MGARPDRGGPPGHHPHRPGSSPAGRGGVIVAVTVWIAAIAGAGSLGDPASDPRPRRPSLRRAPDGSRGPPAGAATIPALAFAALMFRVASIRAEALSWRYLLWVATVAAATWAVCLALVDGPPA